MSAREAGAAAQGVDRAIVGAGTDGRAWRRSAAFVAVPLRPVARIAGDARRLVVVAPHPDDETLGAGGTIASWVGSRRPLLVIAMSRGEASHHGSSEWPPARLAEVRPLERDRALAQLGARGCEVAELGLPDGGLGPQERAAADAIRALLRPGDLVLAPWRLEGHPHHEAAGRAAARACACPGVRRLEYLVWAWHWATPEGGILPWSRMQRVALSPQARLARRRALREFDSQRRCDRGRDAVLLHRTLARALAVGEVLVTP